MGYPQIGNIFVPKFTVVTLCGSMRFYSWMLEVAMSETLRGNIVHMPFVPKDEYMSEAMRMLQHNIEQSMPDGRNMKFMLDEMHKRKIDMCDRIIICSNNVRYIGESTKSEIMYAVEKGKEVSWACDPSTPHPEESGDDYK